MDVKKQIADNQFLPEKDVFRATEDGRQILVARAGTPMLKTEAVKLGLLKQEKAEPPKSNKAATPSENKTEKK